MDDLFSVSTTHTKDKKKSFNKENFKNNNVGNFPEGDLFLKNDNFKKKQKEKKKEGRKTLNIFSIAAVLLIVFVIGIIYVFSKNTKKPAKAYILEYFKKIDLNKTFNLESYSSLTNSLNTKSYEVLSSGKIDPKFLKANEEKDKEKQDEKNIKAEDKLKIKDFDFVFKGAVNNKGDNKSNTIETSLLWDNTTVSSWNIMENNDLVLISAPEYFKEKIGINKANIDKIINKDSTIANSYKGLLNSKDENIFEELNLLLDVIKKSYISSLEKLTFQNFTVDKKISTTYKGQKTFADNYIVHLDKLTVNLIFENILKDIDTSFKIDSNRYKTFKNNQKLIENIIKRFKPEMEDTDKLDLVFYKIKSEVPMVESILKKKDEEIKIFRLENEVEEKNKKDVKRVITAIFGETKLKFNIDKSQNMEDLNIDFETLKKDLKNIKPNDIKIKNPNIKPNTNSNPNTENKENNTQDITNVSFLNEDGIVIKSAKDTKFFTSNENNDTNKEENTESRVNESTKENKEKDKNQSKKENENKKTNTEDVVESSEILNKPKNIEKIMNAKEDEKVFFKFNLKTPENTNASNMKISLNVYSNLADVNFDIKLTFKEEIIIDMMEGDRIFLDELEDSERKAMVDNLIKPTIISVTAKKLDNISKQKQSIQNSNKEINSSVAPTENVSGDETHIKTSPAENNNSGNNGEENREGNRTEN